MYFPIIACPPLILDWRRSGRNIPVRACAKSIVTPGSPGCESASVYIATLQYGKVVVPPGGMTTGRLMPSNEKTMRVATGKVRFAHRTELPYTRRMEIGPEWA